VAAHLPPQHSPIPAPLVCAPAALHPQNGGVLFPPASPAKTLPFPAARARISSSTSSAPRTAHNLRAPGEGRRGYGRRRLHAGGRQASGIEARFVRPPLLVFASGISFVRFVESLTLFPSCFLVVGQMRGKRRVSSPSSGNCRRCASLDLSFWVLVLVDYFGG
jgi:hypothetical protein